MRIWGEIDAYNIREITNFSLNFSYPELAYVSVRSYLYNNYVAFDERQKIVDTVYLIHWDTQIMMNRSKKNKW